MRTQSAINVIIMAYITHYSTSRYLATGKIKLKTTTSITSFPFIRNVVAPLRIQKKNARKTLADRTRSD